MSLFHRFKNAVLALRAPRAQGIAFAGQGGLLDLRGGWYMGTRKATPRQILATLDQAGGGSLREQWELFSLMEDSWPRLAKNLGEVRRAASRATYVVQPCLCHDGTEGSHAQEAQARRELVERALRSWAPRTGSLELSLEDTLFHALDALGKGVSALRLRWEREADGALLPKAARVLGPRRYGWDAAGVELGHLDQAGHWRPFQPGEALVGVWHARTGAPGATATLRSLTPYWLGILFGWRWLMANAQIFGVPFRWATYRRDNPETGAQLLDMLAAMAECGHAAFPEGTQIEFKEASQNVTGNPQVVIQEMADKVCDLLILGQELSGSAQPAGLGGGAAALQGAVRADRLQAAASWCADLLNYQLVPHLLTLNFGDTAHTPVIAADLDEDDDPKALAERDSLLLQAGVPMPRDWFYERHGIPLPQPGEPVITAHAHALPAMPPSALPFPARAGRAPASGTATSSAVHARGGDWAPAALSRAAAADNQPLIERVRSLLALDDDAQFDRALAKLKADFPSLASESLTRAFLTKALNAALRKVAGSSE
jgi:phage gp29-like protein